MLSAEIIKKVKQIQIRTGRQVSDVLAGEYLSVFKGAGMEFDEVRPYIPGDDIRTIDWNVTARMGIPYVKRFVEERELTVLLVVDISPSLDFGSVSRSKREAASELSALLAFSAIQNNDNIGLLLFHETVEDFIPPRKGQKHALRIIREVLAYDEKIKTANFADESSWWRKLSRRIRDPFLRLKKRSRYQSRQTNIKDALEFCQKILHRRAVVFLISDFLDEGYWDSLKIMKRKHDIISVLIEDKRETTPVDVGLLTMQDAETGETIQIDTSSKKFRDEINKNTEQRVENIKNLLAASGLDMIRINTEESTADPLIAFFRQRQKKYRS